MFNFFMLVLAIYLALVGANFTVMMFALSKWYQSKVIDMTSDIVEQYEDMF